jgi:hypothetical protein
MFIYYLCGIKHSVNTNAHIEFRPILAYYSFRRKTLSYQIIMLCVLPIPSSELVNRFPQILACTGLQQNLGTFFISNNQ